MKRKLESGSRNPIKNKYNSVKNAKIKLVCEMTLIKLHIHYYFVSPDIFILSKKRTLYVKIH